MECRHKGRAPCVLLAFLLITLCYDKKLEDCKKQYEIHTTVTPRNQRFTKKTIEIPRWSNIHFLGMLTNELAIVFAQSNQ